MRSYIQAATLAALATMSLPALADATIYGKINLAVESTAANGATTGANLPTTTRVTSNLSHLGFKGEEDLGNGTKAVWQVEQDINPDGCTNCGFANRNSFVGLKGDWGRAIVGRYDMYWTSHIAGMDSRLINAGLAASILSLFGTYGGYVTPTGKSTTALMGGRAVNVLRYDSPNWNGLTSSLTYSTAEQTGTVGKPTSWQVELDYKEGPMVANFAYLHAKDSNGSLTNTGGVPSLGTDTDAMKLVAAYRFSQGTQFGVGAEYLNTQFREGDVKRTAYGIHLGQSLSSAIYIGSTLGKAARVKSNIAGSNTTDTDAKFFTLVGTYSLSKRTMAYVEYARIYNAANAGYYFVSTGSLNTGGTVAGKGADPRTLMVGMNHTF